MNVALTPELAQFIHIQIESGKFSSALEVIEAGMRLLGEQVHTKGFEVLRQEVLIGVEQLDCGERRRQDCN